MKSWVTELLQRFRSVRDASEDKEFQGELGGQRLTLPLALEDGHMPGLFKNAIYVTAGLFVLAFAWATFGQIRELAVAHGKVIPSGS